MNHGTDKYTVTAMGPRGWIATQAWDSTRNGGELTGKDVPADWREQALYVVIEPVFPTKPNSEPVVPFPISGIILKDIPAAASQFPTERKPLGGLAFTSGTWSGSGRKIDYKAAVARFEPTALTNLEVNDVDAILSTDGGMRICQLPAGALRKFAKEGVTKK